MIDKMLARAAAALQALTAVPLLFPENRP